MSGPPSFLGDSPVKATPLYTHTQILDKAFPYYLSIGMSAEEYWDGPNEWKMAYREAHKAKTRENNFSQWLQGRYIYDALCRVAPLFNAFSKKHEAIPYAEEPYPILVEDAKEKEEKRKKQEYEQALSSMKARAEAWNKKLHAGGK